MQGDTPADNSHSLASHPLNFSNHHPFNFKIGLMTLLFSHQKCAATQSAFLAVIFRMHCCVTEFLKTSLLTTHSSCSSSTSI